MNEDIDPTSLGDGCIGLHGESRILPVEATQPHDRLPRQVAAVIAGGALSGLAADSLLRTMPGVNIALFVLVLIIVRILSGRFAGQPLPRAGAVLYGAAFVAALAMAWRDAPTLRGLNGLVCLFMLLFAAVADNGVTRWGLTDYMGRMLSGLFDTLSGAFVARDREILWLRLPSIGCSRNVLAVARGIVLLLPLLVVFGALLVSADAQFEKLAQRLLDWDMESAAFHLLWSVVFAWLATGFFRRQFDEAASSAGQPLVTTSRPVVLGGIEAAVVLVGLNLLFLTFLVVQSHYLFGGREHVTATAGLTLASYARRGFFELTAVAVLVLPMLWSAEWCLRRDNPAAVRWFQGLAGFTVLMMFCIIAGALHRMWLYMQSFGLTELRLYTSAFMIMLAVVFAWFAVTVLRGRRERFLAGAVAIGFASVIAVNAVNPDALITRTNLTRLAEGREIDIRYLTHRSFDAIPAVAQCKAVPMAKHIGESILAAALPRETGRDWRSWNWGKHHAMKLYGVEQ